MAARCSIKAFGLALFSSIIVAHLYYLPVSSADMISLPTSVSFYRKSVVDVCNRIVSPHNSNSKRIQQYHGFYRKRYNHPKGCTFISAHTCNKQYISSHNLLPRLSKSCVLKSTLFSTYTPDDNSLDRTTDIKGLVTQQISADATIHDILHTSIQFLDEQSIPEPDESVLHLVSHALNLDWENGYRQLREVLKLSLPFPKDYNSKVLHSESTLRLAQQTLTSKQRTTYISLLERRLKFEPLQYIIGQWDFHYLTGLIIRKPMLCPRPETEELVELVLSDIDQLIKKRQLLDEKKEDNNRIRLLDVGSGTGAIGIAIAHRYPKQVQVIALDLLSEAVDLSNENADKFLSSLVGDTSAQDVSSLYQAITCSAEEFTNNAIEATDNTGTNNLQSKYEMNFDIVVSNPPYIPKQDMQDLSTDVIEYESHDALCGGDDGLNVVRDIVNRLPEWMSSPATTGTNQQEKGKTRYCWMEVDDSHPSVMEQWLAPGSKESIRLGVEYCSGYKDFCGRDRFVKLKVI